MGVWNETCGITQMPICYGDKVRMFLIVEREHMNDDVCLNYTTDLWRPFGLPLKGTYDEYGRIENIEEDSLSALLLSSLKEIVVEVPNRMGEVFKKDDLTWEEALDFITDEGLKVTDPHHISFVMKRLDELSAKMKEKFPDMPDNGWSSERSTLAKEQKKEVRDDPAVVTMYHMMVHEDIYQALSRDYKAPSTRFSAWTEGDMRKELQFGAEQFIKQVREEIEQDAKDILETDPDSLVHIITVRSLRRLSRLDSMSNRFISATNHLTGNYGSGRYLRKYLDFIEKKLRAGAPDNDADIKNLTDQFIDFVCFNQNMSLLRKLWAPQTGKGGQDREYIIHKFLGERIAAFSEKKMKEWDEECGEDNADIDNGTPEDEDDDAEKDQQVPTEEA